MKDQPEVIVFVCDLPYWETLGMWPCPRCLQLTYFEHGPGCGRTPEEVEEDEEEARNENRPDADYYEVEAMLGPCLISFEDPTDLYEGPAEDDWYLQ